nr:MAG: hypothetical protein [Microviridae sp.]
MESLTKISTTIGGHKCITEDKEVEDLQDHLEEDITIQVVDILIDDTVHVYDAMEANVEE